MKTIAIIPARGGSKGIPGKNIKLLGDKPLLAYSIEAARGSSLIDDVVVTTDDDQISVIAKKFGSDVVKRPPEMAGDESLVMDAVRHVISEKKKHGQEFDLLVLLEPTAPFRTVDDIDGSIKLLQNKNADSVATFSKTEIPPTRLWKIDENVPEPLLEGSDPFLPRQKQSTGYALNGLVYVLKTSMLEKFPDANSFLLGKKMAYLTPIERAVDIDTEYDFLFAEFLINQKNKK